MPIGANNWRLVVWVWIASVGALTLSLAAEPATRLTAAAKLPPRSSASMPEEASKDAPTISEPAANPAEVIAKPRQRHALKSHRVTSRLPIAEVAPEAATLATGPSSVSAKRKIELADASHVAVSAESGDALVAEVKSAGLLSRVAQKANQFGDWISSARKNLADKTGIAIHGLLDFGTNYNFNQPVTGNNLYRVFDYMGASSFEPNQAELYINRAVEKQPGFVIDLNFLNTAQVMHGLTSYYGTQLGPQNPTGWMDPTQVYLTYTVPIGSGINLQAGKYTSLIGFEYIPTWNNTNFNQSIDLLYSLGEPFTVTGLRANYVFNKYVAATLGINNGWDTIATRNVLQTIEAQLSLMPTENITWNMQGMFGPSTGSQSGSKRGLANTTIAWKTPYKPLQAGFEYLFVDQSAPVLFSPLAEGPAYTNPLLSPSSQPIVHRVWWTGLGVWTAYSLTDSIQLATRGEWFDDPSGARSGIKQNLGEITETLNYSIPHIQGLTARLEYRHDFSSEHPFPNSGPVVNFPCPAGICTSTAHTYSGQDTFETALVLTF